jgi:hypothetical protein
MVLVIRFRKTRRRWSKMPAWMRSLMGMRAILMGAIPMRTMGRRVRAVMLNQMARGPWAEVEAWKGEPQVPEERMWQGRAVMRTPV